MLEGNRVGTCWGVPAAEGGWMLTLGSTRVGTCWGFRVGTEVVSGVALEPVGEYEYVERSVRGCKRAGITRFDGWCAARRICRREWCDQ